MPSFSVCCMCFTHSSKCHAGLVCQGSQHRNKMEARQLEPYPITWRQRTIQKRNQSQHSFCFTAAGPALKATWEAGAIYLRETWKVTSQGSRLHVSIFQKHVTSSRFDATTGMCKLFLHNLQKGSGDTNKN